tara:strand:- start:347 stop:10285 length:9939 start_codon:yes stop_codon:yes gene_type:complete
MAKYLYDGAQYDEKDLQDKAMSFGLSLDDYLSKTNGISLVDEEDPIIDTKEIIEEKPKKQNRLDKKLDKVNKKLLEYDAEENKVPVKENESGITIAKNAKEQDVQIKSMLTGVNEVKRERQFRKQQDRLIKELEQDAIADGEDIGVSSIVEQTTKDGEKLLFRLDSWEKYFDESNKKFYDKKLVTNVMQATGITDRAVTAQDYMNYLNKKSSETGGATFKPYKAKAVEGKDENVLDIGMLEEIEINPNANAPKSRDEILNNTDFDKYFDYIFSDNSVFAKDEKTTRYTLSASLPFTKEGSVFTVNKTDSDLDDDALQVVNPDTGDVFILTVGKDGNALAELPEFKKWLKSNTLSTDASSWRRRNEGMRDFYNKVNDTSVDNGGIALNENQIKGLQTVVDAPVIISAEGDVESIVVYDINGNKTEDTRQDVRPLFGTYTVEKVAFSAGELSERRYNVEKENYPGALDILNNVRTTLTDQYAKQGLEPPTEELIKQTAREIYIKERKNAFIDDNIETYIQASQKLNISGGEELRQGFLKGTVNLLDKESQLVMDNAILKKDNAEIIVEEKRKKVLHNITTIESTKFLYGDDYDKALEQTGVNLYNTNFSSVNIAVDEFGMTTEDGYIKKVVDGKIKIQFLPSGSVLPTTFSDGEIVKSIPKSYIDKYAVDMLDLQKDELNYSRAYKEYSVTLLEDVDDYKDQLAIWGKNFNDLQEFGVKLGISGISTAKNIVYAGISLAQYTNPWYWAIYSATGQDPMQPIIDVNTSISKWLRDEKNEYNFDEIGFSEINKPGQGLVQGLKNFGEWMMGMTAETLPIIAAMILSGGSATYGQIISSTVAGLSSAGGKFSDMDLQNFDLNEEISKVSARTDLSKEEKDSLIGNLEQQKVSKAVYVGKGIMYGAIEGSIAYITTSAAISDGYAIMRGDRAVLEELYTNTGQFLKRKGPEWLKGANVEGVGEVGVTWGTNLVDGRPMFEGSFESYAGGFALGAVFEGLPLAHGYMNSNFAANSDLKQIQQTSREIADLNKEKSALENNLKNIEAKGGSTSAEALQNLDSRLSINSRLNDINQQIDEKSGLIMTQQMEVENKLTLNGITDGAAQLFGQNQSKMADLRLRANELTADNPSPNKSVLEELQALNKEYKAIQDVNDKFKSTKLFGHKWLALKGNAIFNAASRRRVQAIEAEAIQNIKERKGPKMDGPTGREIQAESMKILDTQVYVENVAKAKVLAEKGGWNYFNFETNEQAEAEVAQIIADQLVELENQGIDIDSELSDGQTYREYIESQLTETLDGIRDGSINGYFDQVTNTQYTFKENAIKNQKPGVPLHESGHGATTELIRNNPQAFDQASAVLVDFLSTKYNDVWLKMQVEGTNGLRNENGQGFDFEEVFSSFVEEVAAGNIDTKINKAFTAFFAKELNNGLIESSDSGFSIDFKGVNDITQFLINMAKDISKGKSGNALLNEARVIQLTPNVDTQTQPTRVAASKTKRSSTKAPTSAMQDLDNEPASAAAKRAKKNINEAFDKSKANWSQNRQENPAADRLLNRVYGDISGMIENKIRNFVTKDRNVIDLTETTDANEIVQAVLANKEFLGDIRGFDPSNTSLYGYINKRLGFRIRDVLKSGEVFTDLSVKDIDSLIGKETESGAVVQQESTSTESDLNFRQGLKIEENSDLYNTVKDAVRKTFGGKSVPKLEYTRKEKGKKDQTVTLKEAFDIKENPEASQADKNQADIDIARIYKDVRIKLGEAYDTSLFKEIKDSMGIGKNYESYLEEVMPAVMSDGGIAINDLVAMERLSKNKIFAEVEKKNLSPADIKKYEGDGRLVYTSTTSGPTLYKKLNPTPKQFVEFFKKRGRKDALATNMAKTLGFDATMDVLSEPEVVEKMTLGNKDLQVLNADELIQAFAGSVGRGVGTKFSRNFLESNADETLKNIYLNKRQSFFDKLKSLGVTTANVDAAWKDTFGNIKFIDQDNKNYTTEIKKEIKNFVSKIETQEQTYPGIKIDIEEYVSSVEIALENGDTRAATKMLGLTGESASAMFQNDITRKTYSNAINTIVSKMIETDGTSESKLNVGIEFIKYKGLLGNGSNKFIGAKEKGTGVLYGDKNNYIENFLKPNFGITDYQTKTIKGETFIIVDIDGETFTVPYNSPPQKVSQAMIDGTITPEELADRESAADEAWDFINQTYSLMADLVSDPKQPLFDNRMMLMLNAGMSANMNSPLAMAAPLRFLPVNSKYSNIKKPSGSKAYEYEHGLPRRVVNLFLLDYHMNKGKGFLKNEADLQRLKDSYSVGVIDVDMDNNYGKFFKSRAAFNFQLGDLPTSRWYNMFSRGGEVHEVLDTKTNTVYGTAEAKLWKDIQAAGLKTAKQNSSSGVMTKKNSKTSNNFMDTQGSIMLDNALDVARDPNADIKKIRVFDFDDTLAKSNSKVFYTLPDGTRGELSAEEFAEQGAVLIGEGATMDFSDFNVVRDGTRGPLFEVAEKIRNARGNEDLYVLTARAPESQIAIYEFLKSEGLEFKLENIIGLGNSTGEAKAEWLVSKAAEGYNDFYFADDALQNVNAVELAMSQLDVKSQVQQAKVKYSKTVDQVMDDIIFDRTGIEPYKEYSSVTAKARGRGRRTFNLIPPSAQDFGGLLYKLLAKGEKGNAQWAWMQENLIKPFSRGSNDLSVAQNQLMADFKLLKDSLTGIPKNLKETAFGGFTYEDITRIAAWDRQGIKVDGLSDRDLKQVRDFVGDSSEISVFVDQLIALTKEDGYHYPGGDWLAGTITTDFMGGLRKETRPRLLKQFNDNIDLAFNEKTLNKLEAAFGPKYREALEDSIRRMKTGQNKRQGMSRLEQRFSDYINNSVGAVMFLNARSAILQTISAVNFVNWSDNNPLKAGQAFANQKQYWTDFMTLMNSDFLVDRRNGLKINVSESEIAEAAKTTGNSVKGVISYLLNKGFVLTQFADSFAIASGGATLYRNRVKTYMKQGMSDKEASNRAFLDFRELAEESQQSARADKISQQQASTLGRFLLAFANTPSQYARIMDKAGRDLAAGRGDAKANISKIMYYGFVQNLLFTSLQSAMFASFGEEDEEDGLSKDQVNAANSMMDNILRGIGIQGVIISTAKNVLIDLARRSEKEGQFPGPEYSDSFIKLTEVSPPLSIKLKKYKGGLRDYEMNSWRPEAGEPFNINNPSYRAAAKVIAALTNVPLDRAFQKLENIQGAMDSTNEDWQRIAMLLGWPKWQLETKEQSTTRYEEGKEGRKQERKRIKAKNTRQYFPKRPITIEEFEASELEEETKTLFKLNKSEQLDSLRSLGLTTDAIKRLKYEEDRVNKILELSKK